MSSKDSEKIISNSLKGVVNFFDGAVFVGFILKGPKFNSGVPGYCQEPIPPVEPKHYHSKYQVQNCNEREQTGVLLVNAVVPDRDNCDYHEHESHEQVKAKQKEIALVFETHTVVHPGTVVVEEHHTSVTNRAVVSASRLDFLALFAGLHPETREVRHRLCAVSQDALCLRTEPLQTVTLVEIVLLK